MLKRKYLQDANFSSPLKKQNYSKRILKLSPKKKFLLRKKAPLTPKRKAVAKARKGMIMRKGYMSKRKPKKLGKTAGMKTLCQKKGFVENIEFYGVVEDLSCVYLGHSTYDLELYARVISTAVCRKLVELAGISVSNVSDELDWSRLGTGPQTSLGIRVILDISSNAGLKTSAIQEFSSALSLQQFTTQSTVYETIRNLMRDGNDSWATFDKIQLQYLWRENAVEVNEVWRTISEINFKVSSLHVYAHSEMTMQNRTKGSSGEDTDAVTIDNNPLEGYMYQFSGVPITKVTTTNFAAVQIGAEMNELARLRHNGLILRGATDMNSLHWREPPVPAIFQNCKKASKLVINPGEINRTYLYDKWTGAFNTLCHSKLAAKKEASDTGRIVSAPGKTTLFSMEEVINSGDQNPIKLQFQCQKTVGAFITVRKQPHILLQHTETAVPQQQTGP